MTLVLTAADVILQVKIIFWIGFGSASNAFVYLNHLQLVCNFFQNKQNLTNNQLYNHHFVLLIFSDFAVLLNWVINWLIIKVSSINFDVVIFYFDSWMEVFFIRINRNLIITCFIIISKNKQSFNSLPTRIK